MPSRRQRDAMLSSQAFEHDPDLLFCGELPADVADGLLGRVFLGHGFYLLSESRTLSELFPRIGPNPADGKQYATIRP
jgi:hypothetical protein